MKWREIPRQYNDRVAELRAKLAQDPYAILGLSSSASDDELKMAYRKLVRTYHPDKQSDFMRAHAQEVVKIVNEAYGRIRAMRGT
ncbi:MAG: J domain-containing protein [Immundisolibacter sp.]|uniref:J domain-containing protein n=1 Tax=Immundisolibacter sp. TaxID=1934948 RepID=UPI0019AA9BC2|nr:J domain-containing protein [Immundisolibacter sp.]